MTNLVNKKYLDKNIILNIKKEFNSNSPICYYVFDDFIDIELYKSLEEEFAKLDLNIIDKRRNHFVSNKDIILNTDSFKKVYDFFMSEKFESFLQLIYGVPLKKYRKITSEYIESLGGIKNAGVVQIYEKGDYMGWHTDLAKDMQRDKLIEQGGISAWDKCIVTKYDEVGAFIYYIYNSDNNWNTSKGGVLEIGKVDGDNIVSYKEVFPLRNRLVIIKSSNFSYHRVTEVMGEGNYRMSIQDLLFDKYAIIGEEVKY